MIEFSISAKGLDLITDCESNHLKPYKCSAGKWTVGVGHVIGPAEKIAGLLKMPDGSYQGEISQATSKFLLSKDLDRFEKAVKMLVSAPLNQHQFDALVSFTFNCGEHALANSTLLKRINESKGNREKIRCAAVEFIRWNKVGDKPLDGLTLRRIIEAAHYLKYNFLGR